MKKKLKFVLPILFVLIIAGILLFVHSRPPEAEKVFASFEEALCADGNFEFSCMLNTHGESREYFWFTGTRAGENRHLSGRVLGSDLELYYGNGLIYRYDELSGTWQKHDAETLEQAAALYSELEPAGTFSYSDITEITYEGKDRGKRHIFRIIPAPSGWIAQFFTDVEYTVFANGKGQMEAAHLKGKMISDEDTSIDAMLIFEKQDTEIVLPQERS